MRLPTEVELPDAMADFYRNVGIGVLAAALLLAPGRFIATIRSVDERLADALVGIGAAQ